MSPLLLQEKRQSKMEKELQRDFRPIVKKADKSLDKYAKMGLFKDKLDKANEILRTVGPPNFDK